ncbi:hypothetical protein [Aeromicrobium sp. UC242_57]
MSLLEITDLRVDYGKIAAVRGIDLTLDEGEIAVVVGVNGAGRAP